MLDREINPPDSYIRDEERETENIGRCQQCNEPERLYVLGFATDKLNHEALVCSFCLNYLHQNN